MILLPLPGFNPILSRTLGSVVCLPTKHQPPVLSSSFLGHCNGSSAVLCTSRPQHFHRQVVLYAFLRFPGGHTSKPEAKSGYGWRTAQVASEDGSEAGVGRHAGLNGFRQRVHVRIVSLSFFEADMGRLGNLKGKAGMATLPGGGAIPPGAAASIVADAGAADTLGTGASFFGLPRFRLTGCWVSSGADAVEGDAGTAADCWDSVGGGGGCDGKISAILRRRLPSSSDGHARSLSEIAVTTVSAGKVRITPRTRASSHRISSGNCAGSNAAVLPAAAGDNWAGCDRTYPRRQAGRSAGH